jgi:hypothetical protein
LNSALRGRTGDLPTLIGTPESRPGFTEVKIDRSKTRLTPPDAPGYETNLEVSIG